MAKEVLIQIKDLVKYYPVSSGLFSRRSGYVRALDGVSFAVAPGETLGIVGESGCGKTTLGKCILQLSRPTSGEVLFERRDLTSLAQEELRRVRQKLQIIFQDPYDALNPRFTAGDVVGEPLRIHGLAHGQGLHDRVSELLTTVGLAPQMSERYPHEFSGGQRQRLGIARALALQPKFIVCDEPVSALDVSIQAQIINLLADLQARFGLSLLFIAHDLSVVRHISHRVAVMYLGKIVEISAQDDVYKSPLHPYTEALLSSIPIPDPVVEAKRTPVILQGEVPSPINPPSGCVFHTRCPRAFAQCSKAVPRLTDVGSGHQVACLLYGECRT